MHITLEKWRLSSLTSAKQAERNSDNLETCTCSVEILHSDPIDLVEVSVMEEPSDGKEWIKCPLFTSDTSDRNTVASPKGWLNDKVIAACQQLLSHQFVNICGLQSPVLEQSGRLISMKAHFFKS